MVRHNRAKPGLAVDQRQVPQVLSFAPEQIEGVKAGLSSPEQQIFELGLAMPVERFRVKKRVRLNAACPRTGQPCLPSGANNPFSGC